MKYCRICDSEKPKELFWKDKRAKSGLQTYCIDCYKNINKQWKKNHPESRKYRRDYDLWTKYRLRLDDFNELLKNQDLKCPICSDELDLTNFYKTHIDHCHQTGEIRGILCAGCNVALGGFQDSPELLQKAIDYLTGQMKRGR